MIDDDDNANDDDDDIDIDIDDDDDGDDDDDDHDDSDACLSASRRLALHVCTHTLHPRGMSPRTVVVSC